MKQWKRRAALCLTVLLCLSTLCAAASGRPVLTLSSPGTLPAVGGTFQVTVSISDNPGFNAAQFTVSSNSAAVVCVDASIGKLLNGALAASNPSASTGAIIAAANTETMSGSGTLGVLTYKVVAAGDPKFSLTDALLSDENAKDIAFDVKYAELAAGADTGTGTSGDGTGGTASDPGSQGSGQLFTDVPAGHWAFDYIGKAVSAGIFEGMGDGTFHPDDNITRAQFVTTLWRCSGKPAAAGAAPFGDVASSAYYAAAVAWGSEKGYIDGVKNADGSRSFLPDADITREQAMTILFRMSGGTSGMELMLAGVYDGRFTDSGRISPYARKAVYWAIYNGYISGTSDTALSPGSRATRAQTAKILVKYLAEMK